MGFVCLTPSVAIRRPARTDSVHGDSGLPTRQGNVERDPAAPPRTWTAFAETLASEQFVETVASHRKRHSTRQSVSSPAESDTARAAAKRRKHQLGSASSSVQSRTRNSGIRTGSSRISRSVTTILRGTNTVIRLPTCGSVGCPNAVLPPSFGAPWRPPTGSGG